MKDEGEGREAEVLRGPISTTAFDSLIIAALRAGDSLEDKLRVPRAAHWSPGLDPRPQLLLLELLS